jgi:hypothetical protein
MIRIKERLKEGWWQSEVQERISRLHQKSRFLDHDDHDMSVILHQDIKLVLDFSGRVNRTTEMTHWLTNPTTSEWGLGLNETQRNCFIFCLVIIILFFHLTLSSNTSVSIKNISIDIALFVSHLEDLKRDHIEVNFHENEIIHWLDFSFWFDCFLKSERRYSRQNQFLLICSQSLNEEKSCH